MINPMTGNIMVKQKKLVLCYKLVDTDFNGIMKAYSSTYDIYDASNCFEDVIALPAVMVFVNPDKVSKEQFDLLKIYFEYEEVASLIFSSDPHKVWPFSYFVDTELSNAQVSWKNGYDKDALNDEYIEAVGKEMELLETISQLICDERRYKLYVDRINIIEKNSSLYEYINRILRHLNTLSGNGKVQFRQNIHCCLDEVLEKYGVN